MVQSMYAGVLGIQAHQKAMDIEGNNVANVNTIGYKYTRGNFSEMLNQTFQSGSAPADGMGGTNPTQVGLGSEVGSSIRIFKQGALESTDKSTDLAISGDGFFVVSPDGGNSNYYTRAGNFDFDVAGNLVDPSGNKVMGWNSNASFAIDNTLKPEPVQITPFKNISANQTSILNIQGNLNSEDSIGSKFNLQDGESVTVAGTVYTYKDVVTDAATQFNSATELATLMGGNVVDGKIVVNPAPASVSSTNTALQTALTPVITNGTTSTVAPYWATSVDVYDSLGEKHVIQVKFNKTADQTWQISAESKAPVDISADKNAITAGTTAIGPFDVTFNADGSLKANGLPTFAINPNNGASPDQAISLDLGSGFDGLTSLAKAYSSEPSQDGYASGSLEDMSVDADGFVIGVFSNGIRQKLAQVGMARFNNNEGLEAMGGNLFSATRSSGEGNVGVANVGGRGLIAGSTLEMSNADLSKSLTQLIVIQRGFQASSKTITTTDTMLDTLMQMKR